MGIESGPNPDFLSEKYADLPGSKEVDRAVKKSRRSGEHPHSKDERVDAYLDRLEDISEDERGFSLLKHKILDRFTIDTEDEETLESLAEGLYESEKRIAIEQGRGGDIAKLGSTQEIVERYEPLIKEKAENQEKTLSSWLDYLQQNDAKQPMWFRYFAVRNLQKMGTLDKEKLTYSKRTPKTIAAFPELNSESLGWVYKRLAGLDMEDSIDPNDPQAAEKQEHLDKLLKGKDFAGLYAFAQVETAGRLNRETVEGEWKKYDQGSDYRVLEGELKGKGTGWCTAEGSAQGQLENGDFYVYYSKGSDGKYTEPRVAIRMEGDNVGEVRGVNYRQELEPDLIDIAEKQYHGLPGGEIYDKKSADMKMVTSLVQKQAKGESFAKDDLIFLYEINSSIEGFGYEKDPRIIELRKTRNPQEDAPIVFECEPQEIAWGQEQINENTEAYIGPLFNGIFTRLSNLEHLFTAFPEGIIRRSELEIGGKTEKELEDELLNKGFKIGDYAKDMLHSPDFTTLQTSEEIKTIRLKVRDLGFKSSATVDQIYTKAQELGLELCPAETGPYERLKNIDQPMNEWYNIAMKQIADRDGDSNVFNVMRSTHGSWLSRNWAKPDVRWDPGNELMFRLPQVALDS